MPESTKQPKRRLLRFSLRSFLFVVTLFCVWFGWYLYRVERQQEAVSWVLENGGTVRYDSQPSDQQMEFDRALVRFSEITINDIGDERRNGFLRVLIVLEVELKREQEIADAVEYCYPQLDRCLMPILSEYYDEHLKGNGDRLKLRNEIKEEFNKLLRQAGQPTIESVLFDTFIIK